MTEWIKVLDNEERQRQKYHALAAAPGPRSIEEFYPELHQSDTWKGNFSNSLGAYLLPQLLTAPHVVVDLYDWASPNELVKTYGVSFDFLIRLRDEGFVQLCANLPVERYKKTTWLHPILAQSSTIFRSSRTPLYFEAVSPKTATLFAELRDRLAAQFDRLSEGDLQTLSELANATYPPTAKEAMANAFATWATRVKVLVPGVGDELYEQMSAVPRPAVPRLRQLHFSAISPTTAGLGGNYGFLFERLRPYLIESPEIRALSKSEQSKLKSLNDFLAAHAFGGETSDTLATEEYWTRLALNKHKQIELLKSLKDDEQRTQAFVAEKQLRHRIAASGNNWSLEEIEEYVDGLQKTWRRVGLSVEFGVAAPIAVVPLLVSIGPVAAVAAIAGAAASVMACQAMSEPAAKIVGKVFPNLQIVRFARGTR